MNVNIYREVTMNGSIKRSAMVDVVCFVGANAKRDAIVIGLPKSLSKKDMDLLQHAVTRAAGKALTSRRRRKSSK